MEGIKFCLSTGVDKIANFENDLLKFGIKSHRAPIWNKGMDLLLKAFFAVRSSNSNIKPTDKGSTVPYGAPVEVMIAQMASSGQVSINTREKAVKLIWSLV